MQVTYLDLHFLIRRMRDCDTYVGQREEGLLGKLGNVDKVVEEGAFYNYSLHSLPLSLISAYFFICKMELKILILFVSLRESHGII